jgi:Domain of unknown function (DUF4062)
MAKVYISSTFRDLQRHRMAAYRALRRLGHDVIGMEDYVAADERPLKKCLDDVARVDIYIGILAWRSDYSRSFPANGARSGEPGEDKENDRLTSLNLSPCFLPC